MEQMTDAPPKSVFEALGVDINKPAVKSDPTANELEEFISAKKKDIAENMELLQECVNNTISVYEEMKSRIMDKRAELILQIGTFDNQLKAINNEIAKLSYSTNSGLTQTSDTANNSTVRIIEANIEQTPLDRDKFECYLERASGNRRYSIRQALELMLPCFFRTALPTHSRQNLASWPPGADERKETLVLYVSQLYKRIMKANLIDTETWLSYDEEKKHLNSNTVKYWLETMLPMYFTKVEKIKLLYPPTDRRITYFYQLSELGYEEAIKIDKKIERYWASKMQLNKPQQ